MLFSSIEFFVIFLSSVILLYFVLPKKLRNTELLLFSLVFYAWGEPIYVLLMIFSIIMNWLFGLGIHKYDDDEKKKKLILVLSIICNLSLLGFFKYANFAIDNINAIFNANINAINISLPIGISFFTFQAMSYVIDVYRKNADVQPNILNFGLYISLFPQLIAGPIVRYSTVAQEINERKVSFELASTGIKRFVIGLAKKVLIANSVGAVWDSIQNDTSNISVSLAWFGAICYMFQIYFDFSGYSDMAIGLGKIFGFNFLENFTHPYAAKSITDFWNRWHISLSTWFKEYVYIPLGGNRKGKVKQIRNILIVWLLTGLWHGASWNFVLWGLYYGVLLILEKFVLDKVLKKLPAFFQHFYALFVVIIGWVLFAFEDMTAMGDYFKFMFGGTSFINDYTTSKIIGNIALVIISAIASTPAPANLAKKLISKIENKNLVLVLEIVWYVVLFIVTFAFLVSSTYNPFIYFRF
ncbi:MAG TPA: MBOAT family protein [Clostridiales bacterium]|nr:MBOAT family protein [Clostridiales bacterium]